MNLLEIEQDHLLQPSEDVCRTFEYTLDEEQLQRLNVAIGWLQETEAKNFNMSLWVGFEGETTHFCKYDTWEDNKDIITSKQIYDDCGCIACFAGIININMSVDPRYKHEFEDIIKQLGRTMYTTLENLGSPMVATEFLKLPRIVAEVLFLQTEFYNSDVECLDELPIRLVIHKLEGVFQEQKMTWSWVQENNDLSPLEAFELDSLLKTGAIEEL